MDEFLEQSWDGLKTTASFAANSAKKLSPDLAEEIDALLSEFTSLEVPDTHDELLLRHLKFTFLHASFLQLNYGTPRSAITAVHSFDDFGLRLLPRL